MPPKMDKKGTQQNVECFNIYGSWSSVWIPDGKVEVFELKGFLCEYCNFTKIKSLDQIMNNLQHLQLDVRAITEDLPQNSNLGSKIKPLEEKDHTMSEANSATLFSNVETETRKQKEKECNVKFRGLKNLPKHEAEEKINDVFSFLEPDTDPVKIDLIGTTNKQNIQLLLVKMPNPKVKWELIRKAKKLRDDTGFDGIYINPDLTPEQRNLQFETRNKPIELRQSNPLKQFWIKSGRIVETPQTLN